MIINQHCPSPVDVHPRNPRSVKLREQTILWFVDPWAESILGNSWGLSAFLWITGNMVSCFRDLWTDDGMWLWCSLLAKLEALIIALQKCFIPKRSADPNISQYTLINIYHQHIGIVHLPWCFTEVQSPLSPRLPWGCRIAPWVLDVAHPPRRCPRPPSNHDWGHGKPHSQQGYTMVYHGIPHAIFIHFYRRIWKMTDVTQ